MEKAKDNSESLTDVKLLVHTQPSRAGLQRKNLLTSN
ncbi:hypothetical protein HRED_03364 [Candidatus Haloredivivus sp. G17]|nr:hypothetical protein HRED_03364 [Candidatus Haloredivivus sp. G17]